MEEEINEFENIITYTALNRENVIIPLYLGDNNIAKKVRQYAHFKAVGLSIITGFDC